MSSGLLAESMSAGAHEKGQILARIDFAEKPIPLFDDL